MALPAKTLTTRSVLYCHSLPVMQIGAHSKLLRQRIILIICAIRRFLGHNGMNASSSPMKPPRFVLEGFCGTCPKISYSIQQRKLFRVCLPKIRSQEGSQAPIINDIFLFYSIEDNVAKQSSGGRLMARCSREVCK